MVLLISPVGLQQPAYGLWGIIMDAEAVSAAEVPRRSWAAAPSTSRTADSAISGAWASTWARFSAYWDNKRENARFRREYAKFGHTVARTDSHSARQEFDAAQRRDVA